MDALHDRSVGMAVEIARRVAACGGTTFYIGGCVRDKLRKKENKDVDIEVHGVEPSRLEEILDALGERISIGESFGIYNLKGYSLDIAMPRKEENRGRGHRDFEISVDPHIGTYKAAMRRDFTINALMENVLTGEIIDHFGGTRDLQNSVIRHVNARTFVEDPLRLFRAAQFAARFGYAVSPDTLELCRTMDVSALPRERVMGELQKALLKADRPSVFFETLRQMDQLGTWFPELERLMGVRQNPRHHAEGDVWVHTMMVLDAAARFRERAANPLGFMLAAITHDFGKALCTRTIDGEIHAYRHETQGLPLIQSFMNRLTSEKALIDYVLNLSEHHMRPNMLAAARSSVKSTNRMFDESVDPEGLICIAISDELGRIAEREYIPHEAFLQERLSTYREYMSRPYVMGRDLIEAGLKPSANFSKYLEYAHKLRLAGVEKESALRQTLAMARKEGNCVAE